MYLFVYLLFKIELIKTRHIVKTGYKLKKFIKSKKKKGIF